MQVSKGPIEPLRLLGGPQNPLEPSNLHFKTAKRPKYIQKELKLCPELPEYSPKPHPGDCVFRILARFPNQLKSRTPQQYPLNLPFKTRWPSSTNIFIKKNLSSTILLQFEISCTSSPVRYNYKLFSLFDIDYWSCRLVHRDCTVFHLFIFSFSLFLSLYPYFLSAIAAIMKWTFVCVLLECPMEF